MFLMIKWFIILLLSTDCMAKEPLRVVVLDTGLNIEDPRFNSLLCKDTQAIDFTNESINDFDGHGTHVAGIIKENAKNSKYCFTIIKYFSNNKVRTKRALTNALMWIHWVKPALVNFSSGGPNWNDDEFRLIKTTPETKFIVAVGNDGNNLDDECNYYPACYPLKNIYKVGSLNKNGKKTSTTNFGKTVKYWEIGENVKSTLPNGEEGYMSGTSMAAAVKTGKMIYDETRVSCTFNSNSSNCEE